MLVTVRDPAVAASQRGAAGPQHAVAYHKSAQYRCLHHGNQKNGLCLAAALRWQLRRCRLSNFGHGWHSGNGIRCQANHTEARSGFAFASINGFVVTSRITAVCC